MRAGRLWTAALVAPLGAGFLYYACLRLIAPQDFYCERTAETFPWWEGAGLNLWGAIGMGLIVATGVAPLLVRRTENAAWLRAAAGATSLLLAGAAVTIAYLIPYLDHSCGE
jgi:hypothetical protein